MRALSIDAKAHLAAPSDERWEPWREQVEALMTQAKQVMTDRANETLRRVMESIDSRLQVRARSRELQLGMM